jgi:hypothetical protein
MMGHPIFWLLSQPLFWAVLGIGLGPYVFFRGFRLLQLKRRIMGVPRSTIRAAAIGPVEVSGTVVGPYTLIAPLSQHDCLYYRLKIQSNPHHDLANKIHKIVREQFYLAAVAQNLKRLVRFLNMNAQPAMATA